MAQQDRLEAGPLPEDRDIIFSRDSPSQIGAPRIPIGLIMIQQGEALRRCDARPASLPEAADGHFDAPKWIACARSQLLDY